MILDCIIYRSNWLLTKWCSQSKLSCKIFFYCVCQCCSAKACDCAWVTVSLAMHWICSFALISPLMCSEWCDNLLSMPSLLGIQEANPETQLTYVIGFLTWYWDADKSVMSDLEGHRGGVWCLAISSCWRSKSCYRGVDYHVDKVCCYVCDDGAVILTIDIRYAS
jgi:hypothetical protein